MTGKYYWKRNWGAGKTKKKKDMDYYVGVTVNVIARLCSIILSSPFWLCGIVLDQIFESSDEVKE